MDTTQVKGDLRDELAEEEGGVDCAWRDAKGVGVEGSEDLFVQIDDFGVVFGFMCVGVDRRWRARNSRRSRRVITRLDLNTQPIQRLPPSQFLTRAPHTPHHQTHLAIPLLQQEEQPRMKHTRIPRSHFHRAPEKRRVAF